MDVAVRCLRDGRNSDTGAAITLAISASDLASTSLVEQVPCAAFGRAKKTSRSAAHLEQVLCADGTQSACCNPWWQKPGWIPKPSGLEQHASSGSFLGAATVLFAEIWDRPSWVGQVT